ncbi:MAG: rane fusion protein multidrug efflux system [Thermodesulfobacteriota bacterium]|nr:rane fusion protein multidrug efflux system [Thermodesulfobacteriota bacterium]
MSFHDKKNLLVLSIAILAVSLASLCHSSELQPISSGTIVSSVVNPHLEQRDSQLQYVRTPSNRVEGAIIHAYQSTTISAEVSGILERFNVEEGDRVSEGQVIAEISARRYQVIAERAKGRVKALESAVKTAKKSCQLKRQMLSGGASTEQEVLNAEAALEAREGEFVEAKHLLKLAQMDLESCKIRAPFHGFVDQKFKNQFEAVEKSEKLFDLIDASQVFAVAHVPDDLPAFLEKGRKLYFVDNSGLEFRGTVRKLGVKIDPKSRTRKVFVLIPNDESQLRVGLSGSLKFAE